MVLSVEWLLTAAGRRRSKGGMDMERRQPRCRVRKARRACRRAAAPLDRPRAGDAFVDRAAGPEGTGMKDMTHLRSASLLLAVLSACMLASGRAAAGPAPGSADAPGDSENLSDAPLSPVGPPRPAPLATDQGDRLTLIPAPLADPVALAETGRRLPVFAASEGAPGPAADVLLEPAASTSPQEAVPPAPALSPVELGEVALLEADEIDDLPGPPRQIVARGTVIARYQTRVVRADLVIYDIDNHQVYAKGRVELHNEDGSIQFADEIEVDDRLEKGVAAGFSAKLADNTSVVAAFAQRDHTRFNRLENARYTACKLCEGRAPTWALRARRATQKLDDSVIAYRDAVLEVKGVPVLYLPYFFHPDPTAKRKSGFLFPEIGQSSARGFTFGLPFFWAATPSTDVIITPRIFSKINPALQANIVRRFYSGAVSIDGSLTYEREFDNFGQRFGNRELRGHIFSNGRFRITDDWNWGFAAERTTDDLFLDRYAITARGEEQRGLYYSESRRLGSQVYFTRQSENSYVETSANFSQNLRGTGLNQSTPIIGPLFSASFRLRDPVLDGRLGINLSGVGLERREGPDIGRVSLTTDWTTSVIVPGGLVVEPYAFGRGDFYRIRDFGTAPDETFGRGLWLGGLEARYPFIRTGNRLDILVEPVLIGGWGTRNGNDSRIPVEDGVSFELDEASLLRPNAAPNFDLFEGGGRVTAALRATVIGRSGFRFSTIIGRRWRTEADPAFDAFSDLDETSTDYLGGGQVQVGSYFSAFARARLDRQSLSLRRLDAGGAARVWRLTLNSRYLDINRNPQAFGPVTRSREVLGGGTLRLTNHLQAGYSRRRDLVNRFDVSQTASLAFFDGCTRLEFFYTETETADRTFGGTRSFGFRLALATLGDFRSGN